MGAVIQHLPLSLCRLVADPDSPTSRLLERAARRSLAASAHSTPDGKGKFSYLKDIARNPEIARAARAALSSSPDVGVGGGAGRGAAGGGGLQPLQSAPELDSLTAVVDQLDQDAGQESRINQQMASVALGRLTAGRGAAERMLSVLQVRCCLLAWCASCFYWDNIFKGTFLPGCMGCAAPSPRLLHSPLLNPCGRPAPPPRQPTRAPSPRWPSSACAARRTGRRCGRRWSSSPTCP
jgi:hypothetical protein